jgi:1-acyl-sn-glycerol-3-phosphate acyltransferase
MFRYHLIRYLMHLTRIVLLMRFRVHGRENVPITGPFIVTLNHMSVSDTPILLMAFPGLRWRFFAGEKWRTHPIYGPIMTWLGAIYINRGEADRRAIREAVQALKDGFVFGLAPEGSRSKDGQMRHGKGGAAYLASRSKAYILPVSLQNNEKLFANFLKLRRTTVEVTVGEPYLLPEVDGRVRTRELHAYSHLIMVKIAAMLPPSYHGVYAHSPALAALQRGEDPWPHCLELTAKGKPTA